MTASHTTSRSKINEMLILKLNTMNLMKLMMVGLLLSSFLFMVTGCSDNDDSGAKVLLRPVATMEVVQNKAYISWKSVEGATEYVVEVYKVTNKEEELYKTETVSTDQSSCVIVLDWLLASFIET